MGFLPPGSQGRLRPLHTMGASPGQLTVSTGGEIASQGRTNPESTDVQPARSSSRRAVRPGEAKVLWPWARVTSYSFDLVKRALESNGGDGFTCQSIDLLIHSFSRHSFTLSIGHWGHLLWAWHCYLLGEQQHNTPRSSVTIFSKEFMPLRVFLTAKAITDTRKTLVNPLLGKMSVAIKLFL